MFPHDAIVRQAGANNPEILKKRIAEAVEYQTEITLSIYRKAMDESIDLRKIEKYMDVITDLMKEQKREEHEL